VDCFYEGPNFLAINPDECIDCGVCVPECPVDAIVADQDIKDSEFWTELNKDLSAKWPNITRKKNPLPDADLWADKQDKLKLLER